VDGGQTAEIELVIEAVQLPVWPTDSGATASSISQRELTLNWTAAAGQVEQYRVSNGTKEWLIDGGQTSYRVTELTAGTAYTFVVEAGNEAGWTTTGPSVNAATLAVVPEPTPTTSPTTSTPSPTIAPTASPEPTPTAAPTGAQLRSSCRMMSRIRIGRPTRLNERWRAVL
jgi:cell division septation protein DedD